MASFLVVEKIGLLHHLKQLCGERLRQPIPTGRELESFSSPRGCGRVALCNRAHFHSSAVRHSLRAQPQRSARVRKQSGDSGYGVGGLQLRLQVGRASWPVRSFVSSTQEAARYLSRQVGEQKCTVWPLIRLVTDVSAET